MPDFGFIVHISLAGCVIFTRSSVEARSTLNYRTMKEMQKTDNLCLSSQPKYTYGTDLSFYPSKLLFVSGAMEKNKKKRKENSGVDLAFKSQV